MILTISLHEKEGKTNSPRPLSMRGKASQEAVISSTAESGGTRQIDLSHDVSADQILGLIDILYSLGGSVNAMYIGDIIGGDIHFLPHAINIAKSIGLIVQEHGKLKLTELGKLIAKGGLKALREVMERL